MTVTKVTAKSFFETGDKPTQQEFADTLDSIVWMPDSISGVVEVISTASSTSHPIGAFGTTILGVAATASALGHLGIDSLGTVGLQVLSASATASAQGHLGLGTAALVDTGVANGNVPAMDATGYPAADGSQITNVAAAYSNLTGVPNLLQIVDADMSALDIVSTASETTLYSYTVPANTLGTTSSLRMTIAGDFLNNTGLGTRNFTIKIKYGATTLFSQATGVISSGATRYSYRMEIILSAANSTSAQNVNGSMKSILNAASTGSGDISTSGTTFNDGVMKGTSAEDSTGALAFTVTITPSISDAALSFRADTRMIELLP